MMAGSLTPNWGAMGTMDTLNPVDGLAEWLRRMGWPETAADLDSADAAADPAAAALLDALRAVWAAHCQGQDLAALYRVVRPIAVLTGVAT